MTFTILLVDDNPVQAMTRQAILARAGRKVVVTSDASQALAMLDDPELARNVGLVITDHLMPKMNGPEFVSKLRGKFSELPIIVLSGMPDAEREYVGLNIAYQLKPIAPEELIRLVNSFSRDALDRIA